MNCRLVFSNGTELNDIIADNNVYASKTEVTAETLSEDALEAVRVIPEEGEETVLRHAKYDTIYRVDDEWHFALVGASPEEIRIRELEEALSALIGGETDGND